MNEKTRLQIRENTAEHEWKDVGNKAGDQKIPVTASSLPLPTGAATSAKQDTGNASVASIDSNIDKVMSDNSLGISGAKYSLQSHFEAITDWVESVGADNLATSVEHRGLGNNSLEFDKIAGNTVAMISKTIDSLDMGEYSDHSIGFMQVYISDLTDVAGCFVRMGTDSSNYCTWVFADDLMVDGWNQLQAAIANPTSQTGNGYNLSDITYIAFGVTFDAAANTLDDIRNGGWGIKRVLETSTIINADVSVNTPWIGIKDQNSNTRMDVAKGGTYNYLYNRNTDGTNLMPTGDADARAIYVNLGANNDVSTTPNQYELAGNTVHVKKYYTHIGSVSDGIIWSPAAGKRWYITDIFINVSAVATVILEDDLDAGDAVIWKAELYANSGWSHSFTTPWFSGEDAADFTVTTDTGNIYIMVTGYEI